MPWLREHKLFWLMWSIVASSLLAKRLLALRATLLTSCIKILEVREWKKDRKRTREGGFMDWSHVLSALQLSSQSRRHIKIWAAFETSAQMLIQILSSLWITVLSDFDSLRTFFHVIRSFSSQTQASQSIHQNNVSTCPIHLAKPNGGDSRKWSERMWWEPSKSTLRRQKCKPPFYQEGASAGSRAGGHSTPTSCHFVEMKTFCMYTNREFPINCPFPTHMTSRCCKCD